MLVILGFLMVAAFMFLILTKRATPVVALILVPVIFGLFAGAGLGIGDMITDGIKSLAPTAALLFFAIIFFGIMIDVGLFDPLVRGILRLVRNDPMKLVVGTAVLAMVVSLDGDGSTTFIIVTSALLPLYLKLGVSPVILTVVAGLANGTMNIIPWGGPTVRAASALGISPSDVFIPMVPSMIAGLIIVLLFSIHLGLMERRRLGSLIYDTELVGAGVGTDGTGTGKTRRSTGSADITTGDDENDGKAGQFIDGLDPNRDTLRPKLLWFNAILTVTLLVILVMDILPIPVLFMIAASIALTFNFPKVKEQGEAIARHSASIVSVVAMVLAAAVLTGVFSGTGMVEAMAEWLLGVIPDAMGPFLAVITGILSIPLTFFMTNDAFYFGILPVLTETAAQYGIEPVEMARASITGQPVHLQSPLVPAILLLVTLAGVSLADHHRKVLWRATVVSLTMLAVGVLLGQIPFG
ncbi:citrate:proton symporter [Rhodococcus sp. BP-149]|uniref:CitMHS family transporter n=1 Tax=unclassified Rhodococcus (in: high G+C Gram-positive bacteria) TaxID=192944 RepID=UPI001C9B10EC|nr:citrate:proton symporter [Rhodococcus sp. BP-288]MBY6695777.1 citrate:proton symporter [Rhodococcus sp. BP-188]MBY6700425.1 citrate:proton symporter [Rhodococcus sp. BP-285]MBY6704552.1 citrate:proton symporter [Rhodococcus sp. BP-283]MBY6713550.1 citrate:proton symporter [Rhodococcus sp. BP-160]MBY6717388.1 citrate:proton symporter [Rhodococcus sp. BP-110]MBY6721812.1 citrate:proton symporter [Rhodococcus sp. BP-142]MBY6726424.1 citrate:proton symporter [Rhodococcus sp. BP-149]MBY673064